MMILGSGTKADIKRGIRHTRDTLALIENELKLHNQRWNEIHNDLNLTETEKQVDKDAILKNYQASNGSKANDIQTYVDSIRTDIEKYMSAGRYDAPELVSMLSTLNLHSKNIPPAMGKQIAEDATAYPLWARMVLDEMRASSFDFVILGDLANYCELLDKVERFNLDSVSDSAWIALNNPVGLSELYPSFDALNRFENLVEQLHD